MQRRSKYVLISKCAYCSCHALHPARAALTAPHARHEQCPHQVLCSARGILSSCAMLGKSKFWLLGQMVSFLFGSAKTICLSQGVAQCSVWQEFSSCSMLCLTRAKTHFERGSKARILLVSSRTHIC